MSEDGPGSPPPPPGRLKVRVASPTTPDLPGFWKGSGFQEWCMMPMMLERSAACSCLHWTPEPRYGDKCPNCGAEWVKWETQNDPK